MDIRKEIKKLIIEENTTVKELANKLGTTPTNISNKFSRNNMKINDIINISHALGYKVKIQFEKYNDEEGN